MGEYNGRINVTKDTMIFVVNSVFENNIKESTTKEDILKMMPDIYENADEEKIIEMLPYRAYKDLERLTEYAKTSDDIIEKLKVLFSEENKKIAKRYGEIEDLTKCMLYAYGIVDFEFLRKQLSKYMNEIITETELRDIYFTRLNLNTFINDYNIRWTNTNEIQAFVTYLDEEEVPIDIGQIAEEQKARRMKYKQFSKQELLKREEYLYDERAKKLYKFLKSKNDNIYEWTFKRLLKNNELGIDILGDLSNMCMFEDDKELKKFMELFTDWYNNSPQYMLGGYSPIEFRETFK